MLSESLYKSRALNSSGTRTNPPLILSLNSPPTGLPTEETRLLPKVAAACLINIRRSSGGMPGCDVCTRVCALLWASKQSIFTAACWSQWSVPALCTCSHTADPSQCHGALLEPVVPHQDHCGIFASLTLLVILLFLCSSNVCKASIYI